MFLRFPDNLQKNLSNHQKAMFLHMDLMVLKRTLRQNGRATEENEKDVIKDTKRTT